MINFLPDTYFFYLFKHFHLRKDYHIKHLESSVKCSSQKILAHISNASPRSSPVLLIPSFAWRSKFVKSPQFMLLLCLSLDVFVGICNALKKGEYVTAYSTVNFREKSFLNMEILGYKKYSKKSNTY